MASLDKLAIRGVRSFDPTQIAMIHFLTPLTVIVGTNGSGKTTIIECLKYSTTGDLPPNSKGGAFVHDPGMATTNDVKAQIRLRFFNTNGVKVDCVRNLQVTRKKGGGLTQKTLESLLNVESTDENRRSVLSTKCAEVDAEMPALLGVSRAILDYVIFCHQEDNNWPLGDPSSLKKRFDDIFEATRYTKALDNIRSLRKERASELKVDKAVLEGLKIDRQRADAVKGKMRSMEAEVEAKEARLERLNIEIDEITVSNKSMYDKAVKFRETVQRAESLEDKKQLHEESLDALKASMTDLQEDEEELQRRKNGFQSHLRDLKRKQDDLNRRIDSRKDELADLERSREKRLSDKGAMESDKKHHERAVLQRQTIMKKVAEETDHQAIDPDSMTNDSIDDFIEGIQDELHSLKVKLDSTRVELQRKEDEKNTRYQDLRSMVRAKESSRMTLGEDVKRLKDRIRKMQSELDSTLGRDADVEEAKKDHVAQRAKLEELIKEQTSANHENKLRVKNTEIREHDDRREDLTTELTSLNRQADFRAKLDMHKLSAAKKTSEIDAVLSRNAEALNRFCGGPISPEALNGAVNTALSKQEQEVARKESALAAASKRLHGLETGLSYARKQLKDAVSEAEAIEAEMKAALDGGVADEKFDTLDDALKECQKEMDTARKDVAVYESMTSFIKNLDQCVKDKRTCLGCNRGIEHNELPNIEAHIADLIQKAQPAKLQEYKDDAESWEAALVQFQELKPMAAKLDTLRNEDIPRHEKDVEEAEQDLLPAGAEADNTSAEVETSKNVLRELTTLRSASSDVTRMLAERAQAEKDTASIESDLRSTGSTRTGDEVQREIDDLTDKIKRAKRDVQTLQQEKDKMRTVIAGQERKIHEAALVVAQKTQEQEKILAQQRRLEEMKTEQDDLERRSKIIDADIDASKEPLRILHEELSAVKIEAAEVQTSAQDKVDRYGTYVRQLQESNTTANRFIIQRGPQKLKECQDIIEQIQSNLQEVNAEVQTTRQEVARIEKDLNESRATERNISDNLRALHLTREVKAIDDELSAMNLEEASRANREWNDKYTASKRTENDLNGKAAHLNGEIASLRAQVDTRRRELKDDFKNVHKNFTRKLIEVKTSELAQNDLELYQKALNAGIMRFHSIKMEEINETLNNLWAKTYKGTDIDAIRIVADADGVGMRTYNYRVVMVKDSIEMDMRGRCSAGQKCLASILIRLSLADSFSENCGMMALDEPTTNLDEHNIIALAESLGTLIEERRKQSNFQLIVITHDTKFLSQLSQYSGGIERYYVVERDENYRSTITQETQLP